MSNKGKTLVGHRIMYGGWGVRLSWIYSCEELHFTEGLSFGFGICECGLRSEVLPSNNKRKQWHREHKEAIRKAQV